MSKRPFVIFGTFAVICLIALPLWALAKEGSSDASPEGSVPASEQEGLELFQINCGACHTLSAAGTDGVVGPDLDLLLRRRGEEPRHGEREPRPVDNAILEGRAAGCPRGSCRANRPRRWRSSWPTTCEYIPGP